MHVNDCRSVVKTDLSAWNNYEVSLYYISDEKLYSLQYILQNVLRESQMINDLVKSMPAAANQAVPPNETLKFAICIIAAIPMIIAFPFFQKFFSKGIMIGSIKG